MIFVLLRLNVILQEHFDLVVHLWRDIFAPETRDHSQAPERQRRECHVSDPTDVALLPCGPSSLCNLCCHPRNGREDLSRPQRGQDSFTNGLRAPCPHDGRYYILDGGAGNRGRENRGIDCRCDAAPAKSRDTPVVHREQSRLYSRSTEVTYAIPPEIPSSVCGAPN